MKRRTLGILALVGVAAVTVAAVAVAAPPGGAKNFVAVLKPGNEAPPVAASKATGLATLNVRKVSGADVVNWKINAANFGKTNKITAAHIHCGAKGVAGDIVVALYGGPEVAAKGNVLSGQITAASTFTGACGVTNLAQLLAKMRERPSQLYVNVHSQSNAGGEIRGQIKAGKPS